MMRTDQPMHDVDVLQGLLAEQLGLYNQLAGLIEKERTALVTFKNNALNDIISEKVFLVQLIEEVERRRMNLMKTLSNSFGVKLEKLTLMRLAGLVDSETSDKLLKLKNDLSIVINTVQKANNDNKRLMTHFISLADNSINMLSSMLCGEPNYISTGHFARTQEAGLVLSGKI